VHAKMAWTWSFWLHCVAESFLVCLDDLKIEGKSP
jgi:hypothetical protein